LLKYKIAQNADITLGYLIFSKKSKRAFKSSPTGKQNRPIWSPCLPEKAKYSEWFDNLSRVYMAVHFAFATGPVTPVFIESWLVTPGNSN
jgi:hypothetical protein